MTIFAKVFVLFPTDTNTRTGMEGQIVREIQERQYYEGKVVMKENGSLLLKESGEFLSPGVPYRVEPTNPQDE